MAVVGVLLLDFGLVVALPVEHDHELSHVSKVTDSFVLPCALL